MTRLGRSGPKLTPREEDRSQASSQLEEVGSARAEPPQRRCKVIDGRAAAASEAVPAALGRWIHVQAWRAVVVERAAHLPAGTDVEPGQDADEHRRLDRAQRVRPVRKVLTVGMRFGDWTTRKFEVACHK